jgi:mRNA interferase MazF
MLEPGRVAIISFPFSDLTTSKRRPVLLLTAPDHSGDFICMAVTSRPHHHRSIPIVQGDFANGELPVASFVRADKVYTLAASLVVREAGTLSGQIVQLAIASLCEVIRNNK